MRILSKFQDYYDSAMAQGQDRGLVYLRERQEMHLQGLGGLPEPSVELKRLFLAMARGRPHACTLENKSPGARYRKVAVNPGVLLVGGKIYPFAQALELYPKGLVSDSPKSWFLYSYSEYEALLAAHGQLDKARARQLRWVVPADDGAGDWKSFFDQAGDERLHEMATVLRVPVAGWYVGHVSVNPKLADVQFFKQLDAWQAFQEISMFLGNLAAPERNTVAIADKYRVAQHGFDEYSFRKPPSKRH
jgi:hypothetical protein